MTEPLFIPYRQSRLYYHRFGTGPSWIFCFHGYGEDGSRFQLFEKELGQTYTLIALDMPFHGKTEWKETLLLEPALLMAWINDLVPQHTPVQLMGYSMGGRVCLRLLELFPHRFTKLVLIAPDGLHKNPWQKLATQTFIGNKLFAYTMSHPGWMFLLMKLAGGLGLLNKSILKFVHHYLDHEGERKILYKRWTTMRRFRPHLPSLKRIILQHQIPVHLQFGKYDRVIVAKHGYHFQEGLKKWIVVKEIAAGHHLLQEKYKAEILEAF